MRSRGADQPVDRGHVDDAAPAAPAHPRQGQADEVEGGGEVDRDILVPGLGRHCLDRGEMPGGGIVHQDVDVAGRGQHGGDVGGPGQLGRVVAHRHAVAGGEAGHHRRGLRRCSPAHAAAGSAPAAASASATARPMPPVEPVTSAIRPRNPSVIPRPPCLWRARIAQRRLSGQEAGDIEEAADREGQSMRDEALGAAASSGAVRRRLGLGGHPAGSCGMRRSAPSSTTSAARWAWRGTRR